MVIFWLVMGFFVLVMGVLSYFYGGFKGYGL